VAEEAVLEVTPLEIRLLNLEARLTATGSGAPLAGQTITFTVPALEGGGDVLICSDVTDGDGVASCNGTAALLSIALNLGYDATFAGTPTLAPASDNGPLLAL
jgi:hypothetical protein